MGLLKKKKKEGKRVKSVQATPPPELPKLPEFPKLTDEEPEDIHKLPKIPSSSFGKKFSRDTIKEAVTGDKEDEELLGADEFVDRDEMRMMQEPLKRPLTEEIGGMKMPSKRITEPVFVRIDKFEEALKIFHQTKRKISEIERILEDIKRLKEKEDKDLQMWESDMASMKTQIEKIDKDIFSKV